MPNASRDGLRLMRQRRTEKEHIACVPEIRVRNRIAAKLELAAVIRARLRELHDHCQFAIHRLFDARRGVLMPAVMLQIFFRYFKVSTSFATLLKLMNKPLV